MMKSTGMKRSIVISGHKTSISLEEPFWCGLKEIAKSNNATLSSVVANIESTRQYGNLSSAIRLFVLAHSRAGAPPGPAMGIGAPPGGNNGHAVGIAGIAAPHRRAG
jgi:predicted DNA-binding ribbon-helix-helix protein